MVYSPILGNGELTPEQRRRLFHAVSVPVQALGLYDRQELQTIADAGGQAEVESRLKIVAIPEGTAIIAVSTGGDVDSRIPVINAVLDPLSGLYTAEIPGAPPRHLQISPDATLQPAMTNPSRLAVTPSEVLDIPSGVDLRIQDCIVCVPGLPPTYLSFSLPPMGAGVVTGTGQPATTDWWNSAPQTQGAAIPAQIGDQFRGREFKSFEAFDKAVWQTLGEHRLLAAAFDEVNKKRIEQGFAPYAPKSMWVGENREFELRYQERSEFWSDPFNLDKISIKTPNNAEGWLGIAPAVVPWPIPPATSWKPLVPPGSEHLGSTTSPITPTVPVVNPGNPAIPVLPQNETVPAVDEGEINASIPGYPGDMDLPSPGLVFVGPPVELLEVGPYKELSSRSKKDGLDIDHIPSRKALETHLEVNFPELTRQEVNRMLNGAPSVAIPAKVHQKYSETYGGRNSKEKQAEDSSDISNAIENNFQAIKEGLANEGVSEVEFQRALEQLHTLSKEQGWH
ncbi:hypothetical protein PS838_01130 [Pseudomonas fluorescens]|nr:hypothetical protein PS838_01130 [Pseudomonas fluorescens]